MWRTLQLVTLTSGLVVVVGCHHDKYNLKPPKVEEYALPPDDPRYNNPETAPFKKPPTPTKDDKSLLGKPGGGMPGPGSVGGF